MLSQNIFFSIINLVLQLNQDNNRLLILYQKAIIKDESQIYH